MRPAAQYRSGHACRLLLILGLLEAGEKPGHLVRAALRGVFWRRGRRRRGALGAMPLGTKAVRTVAGAEGARAGRQRDFADSRG